MTYRNPDEGRSEEAERERRAAEEAEKQRLAEEALRDRQAIRAMRSSPFEASRYSLYAAVGSVCLYSFSMLAGTPSFSSGHSSVLGARFWASSAW
jgi:hypothetical protein